MRVPSVSPRRAVPWVPSNEVQRGNGIGETPEEGGSCILGVKIDIFFKIFFVFVLSFGFLYSTILVLKITASRTEAQNGKQ